MKTPIAVLASLLLFGARLAAKDLVVAADGSGDFKTVQAAIDAAPSNSDERTVILIRRGTYAEKPTVPAEKKNLTLRGEDRHATIIAETNNARLSPRRRELFTALGEGFILENLTLHNTTPKGGSQAETIRVRADRVMLRHCDFKSFQDTLRLDGRVYVDDCYIEGDVDYVWGGGAVYFNRCELKALHNGYLVQSRNGANNYGYVFVDCTLTAAPEVKNYILARIEPSRFPFSHVAFIDCKMGDFINPAGWQFDKVPNATTLGATERERFWEYHSTDLQGKPLDVGQRIAPSRQLSASEAAQMRDPAHVLAGWDPRAATTSASGPSGSTAGTGGRVTLWNGRDLDGWTIFLGDKTEPQSVWSVRDGALRFDTKASGYIKTRATFSNYHLHVEWRWPKDAAANSNSGVMLHVHGPDVVWPLCFEAQLKNRNAGQVVGMGLDIPDAPLLQNRKRAPRLAEPSENPLGEWNTYEIYARGDVIEVSINGVKQNHVDKLPVSAGAIALQMEGYPIEFRNVWLESL